MDPSREAARERDTLAPNELGLPASGPVRLPPAFINGAGKIQNLLERPCGGVAIIESKAGSERSNHYHRSDAHWLYVVSGRMHYYEREVGYAAYPPEPIVVGPGQCIFTPSMVEHKTVFPVDTVIVSMSLLPRDAASHESDLVRVKP